MPRLFLGLELPEAVKDVLLCWHTEIAGARWQRRDQLHLTLCFLGQLDPEQVPEVFAAMADITAAAFEAQPRGVRCFGQPDRPRTLWADIGPEDALTALHLEVARRVQDVGLPVEQRNFTPHITLARFSRREAGSAAGFLEHFRRQAAPVFRVDRVSLFLSHTIETGPRYQVLARFPLAPDLTAAPAS